MNPLRRIDSSFSPNGTHHQQASRRGLAVGGLTVLLIALAIGATLLPHSKSQRIVTVTGATASTLATTPTTLCADEKPGVPSGCWTAPAGYTPAPKTKSFTPIAVPDDSSDADIPAGTITTNVSPPFSASDYVATDEWWNDSGSTFYDVFAGYVGGSSSQGVVVVFSGPTDDPTQTGSYSLTAYPTSGQDGALSMVSSDGWTIDLEATDGTSYQFNVSTDSYT